MVCREVDNDVIMGQRPSKYKDGTFPAPACQDSNTRTVAIDYVILQALRALWAGRTVNG